MIAALIPYTGRDTLLNNVKIPAWSRHKSALDAGVARAGHTMPAWVLHDLRRTVVTRLNDLGVEPHVIEALVNHVSGAAKRGTAGVYNKSCYAGPKAAALRLWCEHVRTLAGEAGNADPARVVTLRRAG
jgi:hypothetical protein